ncbi:sensor histidine kinase [Paenibacillus pasadenensis]|uniref:sensor histidine kinase n=1 Tax=Paenibacillus TaxID=44249 RepID=UPI00042A6AD4|nr:sensor histidine kinase [Paenibacillus pasadenensis]
MRTFLSRLTIYPKLVLSFLLLLVPLVAISLLMNAQSERLVRDEIIRSTQAKAASYMRVLEYDFGPLITLQQQYAFDDEIRALAYSSIIMSDQQYTESIQNVQKKLTTLKFMSSYVSDAFVLFPGLDRKVSADSYGSVDPEQAAALNQVINPYEAPFLVDRGRLWLSSPYPSSPPVGKGFTIGMELSGASIRRLLSGFELTGEGAAMLTNAQMSWQESYGPLPDDATGFREELASRMEAGSKSGLFLLRGGDGRKYAFYETSSRLGLTLVLFLDERSFLGPIQRFGNWTLLLAAASTLLALLFAYGLYRIIHSPLRELVRAFKSLEKGDLSFKLRYRSRDEFNYLYLQYNRTVSRLQELIDEAYVQQYQVKAAELKQLQSQINPHFLYNCLFNLYRLAKLKEHDKVAAFTKHLGDYFRYVTKNADKVPLRQEMMFVNAYAAIQTIRFEEHIRVELDPIPPGWEELAVPKLLLQPLVENAYHHGLEDRSGQGLVRLSFREEDGRLLVHVDDNGEALDEERLDAIRKLLGDPGFPSDSEGLRNVQLRLRLHFGEGARLTADRSPLGGLSLTLVLPAEQQRRSIQDEAADRGQ